MTIKLRTDVKEQLIGSLRRYWMQENDEQLGDLRAQRFLQFIVDEIGPSIYNQAIQDAQTYMQEKAAEMEIRCYAEELTYWSKNTKNPRR